MTSTSTSDLIKKVPKVELHLHLEGAIPLSTLWQLIEKYDGATEFGNISRLEEKFVYKDFSHFIETWLWKNEFLREYEDFTLIAGAVAEDLARQTIRYAEVFYSPGDFVKHGLEPQKLTEAIREGLNLHADKITINLVADLIRDFGPEKGLIWLREIAEVQNLGVIGIGIGGAEHLFPPEPYQEVFEEARKLGFKTTAHAGEAAGATSIWGAVNALKVDRIGHGTRAIEDPDLVAFLKEQQIPIEMCPISNLKTGVVPDLAAHPIAQFYNNDLLVFVNTDDPQMFNNTLKDEYTALIDIFEFGFTDIIKLIQNAIKSAWCDEETKQKLCKELDEYSE